MMHSPALNIGIIGFDGVTGLDLVGPAEVFTHAAAIVAEAGGRPPYALHVIGLHSQPFTAESGLVFTPQCTLANAPALDTLIIPGGAGLRDPAIGSPVAEWISANANGVRRIASICTGIYGLASTGLLDGRRVTTHWRYAENVRRRFPSLDVDGDAIFAVDGRFFTSAGITAGIDLSLVLIEQDLGSRVALRVAREMVVYLRRPGGQSQFSEPLRFQTRTTDQLADLIAWVGGHLMQDLSVKVLADRACLSPRQFHRRFVETFGCTAAAYVEELRLSEARIHLTNSVATIDSIAASIGFKSADAFRRAFERKFGIGPGHYRNRFVSTSISPNAVLKETM